VLLFQKWCGIQRTLLNDQDLHLPLRLEWWRVPQRMNDRHSSSEKWFERERRETIVYDEQWEKP
jgi:hypothetical protein